MKMEIPVAAPVGGRLVEIQVVEEDVVGEGDIVAVLETLRAGRRIRSARGGKVSGKIPTRRDRARGRATAMLTAIILINTERTRTIAVGEALAEMEGISEVYTVAGRYDLVAMVRVSRNEDLADLVTRRVSDLDGIRSTETLMAFRTYSRHDLESLFAVGLG